jgi:hypothetical protein
MISNGTKVEGWEKQEKASRMAAVGMDKDNCVLFVFTRARVSTQDFIQVLLSLGVQIQSAMYVEGGPEAALHLVPDQKMGSGADHGDKGLWKDAENEPGLPIPNVIGIVKKK